VGDLVKYEVEKLTGHRVEIVLKNIADFRNYKVAIEKARTYLGFQPRHTIEDIIQELYENKSLFEDYERDEFYNIRVFKKLNLH
jgi:nucleoside-diphosphate-sugar epimerase